MPKVTPLVRVCCAFLTPKPLFFPVNQAEWQQISQAREGVGQKEQDLGVILGGG